MPEKLCDLSQVTVVSEGVDLHLSSSAPYPVLSLLNHATVLVSYLLRLEKILESYTLSKVQTNGFPFSFSSMSLIVE